MKLQNIRLIQFKNYSKANFEFVTGINCLLGKNGVGKTNILDAIHYLAFTKSAFNAIDKDNILHGSSFFSIKANFHKEDKKSEMLCAVQQGERKIVRWEGKEYDKLSEHIGKIPLVMIVPQDTDIVRETSELRRKFFDNLLCQLDQKYMSMLVKYNHLLKQRNALLKNLAENNRFDVARIEPYDELMIPLAIEISEARKALMEQFVPVFEKYYQDLADGREAVNIDYQTSVEADFSENFKSRRKKDFMQGRTTLGIHRDDFLFVIDAYPLKKFGSQGQQKSFVIALKLAQFEMLHQAKSQKPLLLLDDIFDKLDDKRIAYLLQMIADERFGQIFLTDARPERTQNYLDALQVEKKYFHLQDTIKENESV